MKTTNKFLAVLMVIAMVLSMGAFGAFAEESYQYEIYQIFTGDYANGVLSNIKWGENGIGKMGTDVDETTLTALANVATSSSDAEKLAVIEQYANLDSTPVMTVNTSDDPYTVTNLDDGYYLVKDVAGSQKGEDKAYTTYVVKVVDGTLSITRKADVPKVEKEILDYDAEVKANEASIGDTVNYKFTGTMPSNIADYDTYYYVFTDTLSKGLYLTSLDDFTVTVNGKDVTKYFYIYATDYDATNGTTITVGIQDILALENLTDPAVGNITASTEVVVTYSAVLNDNAVIGDEGNPNYVDLEYSNNPNDDGEGTTNPPSDEPNEPKPVYPTGKTPKDEVITYTTELIIKKTDENGKVLPGAAFKIEGDGVNVVVTTGEYFIEDNEYGTYYKLKDGTYTTTEPVTEDDLTTDDVNEKNSDAYVSIDTKYTKVNEIALVTTGVNAVNAEAFVDSTTGELKFTGLGAGNYTITETVTPAGYNSIAPIEVTIGWDAENGFTYEGTTGFVDTDGDEEWDEDEPYNVLTIINRAGSTLPETGSIGTTIFYIVGGVMVAAAVIFLVTKKRMKNAEN